MDKKHCQIGRTVVYNGEIKNLVGSLGIVEDVSGDRMRVYVSLIKGCISAPITSFKEIDIDE